MINKSAFAALALASSLGAAHAGTLNVALDGYCNTFALQTSGITVAGTRSGCGYTVIDGGSVAKAGGIKYTITNDTNDGSLLFTWYFTKPVGGAGTWMLYASDGSSQSLYGQGTYTATTGLAAPRGSKDVTGR